MPAHHLRILIVLLLLTLAAAISRGLALNDSLWIDELHTSWVVSDSLDMIGPRARLGNQQPLYFYLPWISIQAFGHAEWSLRLPSYLAGVALIPALFFLARSWLRSDLAAVTVAALALLDRQWLFYGQEARVYSIVQLAAVGQFALLYHVLVKPSWRSRLALVALSAAMFYLHYTTALLTLAMIVAAAMAIIVHRGSEYRWRHAALDTFAYLVLTLPAWPHVFQVADRRENWEAFVRVPEWLDLWTIFPLSIYVGAALLIGGVLIGFHRLRKRPPSEADSVDDDTATTDRHRIAVLVVCWLLIPLLLAWLTTRTEVARLFFPRYLIGISAAAMLIAGLMVALQKSLLSRAVAMAGIVYLAAWQGGWLVGETYSTALHDHANEDWREAIASITEHNTTSPILVDAGLIETAQWFDSTNPLRQTYCTFPTRGLYAVDPNEQAVIPYERVSGKIAEASKDLLEEHSHAWLLVRGRLPRSGMSLKIESSQSFGSIGVYRIALPLSE